MAKRRFGGYEATKKQKKRSAKGWLSLACAHNHGIVISRPKPQKIKGKKGQTVKKLM